MEKGWWADLGIALAHLKLSYPPFDGPGWPLHHAWLAVEKTFALKKWAHMQTTFLAQKTGHLF